MTCFEWTPRTECSSLSVTSPCFTPGTLIATEKGQRPVESLRRGDRVVTRDNGLRRINWVGRRSFGYDELAKATDLQPILVKRNAYGHGYPSRDTIISPNHRFLVGIDTSHDPNGADEELIAARHLIDGRRVKPASMLGVSYIHILCSAHEVILANGIWTESFHPDDAVMRAMADEQREEILTLFPEIATMGSAKRFPAARPIQKSRFET